MRKSILAVALTVMAMAAFAVSPAYATTVDLACLASIQLNFTPALTATSGTVDVTASAALVDCTSTDPAYASYASAIVSGTNAEATGSSTIPGGGVCSLNFVASGSSVLQWDPAGPPNSRFDWTASTDPTAPGGITLSATVVSGPFQGDTMTAAGLVTPNPDCLFSGLTRFVINPAALTFSH